jgi:D-beta-D-heptose 7-phosphate kinase/D-beta-D-heptose 1-phosphate adenosyltransferase
VARTVIEAARAAQRPIVVDPRGRDFTRYDGASVLKPNAQELSLEAGMPCGTDAEVAAALHVVMAKLPRVERLLVTRGAGGIALLPRGGEVSFHRARARDVFDVSGAGDTTIAALALALGAGAPIESAITFANRTAGIAVGKTGTAVVTPAEVLADARADAAKRDGVVDLATAAHRAAAWRAAGLTVGLTNGVFDILHVGHLQSLETAKSHCDRLIVAVNADAAVKRLKGPSRPVNSEADRAALLAGLTAVDLVVIFEEDTATTVVEAVRPNVYVKGGDYSPETLPEAEAVRGVGGEFRFAPLTPGRSTTAILARASGAE